MLEASHLIKPKGAKSVSSIGNSTIGHYWLYSDNGMIGPMCDSREESESKWNALLSKAPIQYEGDKTARSGDCG